MAFAATMARWLVVMAEGVTWFIAAVRFNRGPNLNFSEPLRPETPEVRKVEDPRPHVLLASADAHGLVASVRAVVERAVEAGITPTAEGTA